MTDDGDKLRLHDKGRFRTRMLHLEVFKSFQISPVQAQKAKRTVDHEIHCKEDRKELEPWLRCKWRMVDQKIYEGDRNE